VEEEGEEGKRRGRGSARNQRLEGALVPQNLFIELLRRTAVKCEGMFKLAEVN